MRARYLIVVVLLLAGLGFAQRHRDPLTSAEIDQIRDTSWEPRLRLPLYWQLGAGGLVVGAI